MTAEPRRTLHEIFLANGGRIIHKWGHYFDIYEQHLRRFVDTAPLVVEIGVGEGGSLLMWQEYFGPGAHIVGMDNRPDRVQFVEPGIDIVIGDQADPSALDQLLAFGTPDIVIDDGSHRMTDLLATFDYLYEKVSPTGIYLAEDLHTCFSRAYGGGPDVEDTFLNMIKGRVDELYQLRRSDDPPSFAKSTRSICVYDGIVVLERSPQGKRVDIETGATA